MQIENKEMETIMRALLLYSQKLERKEKAQAALIMELKVKK